jgi:hypothetical protein
LRTGDPWGSDSLFVDADMADAENTSPFFVLGAARSGTTMLRLMLNRHPRLSIPPESHFLLPLFAELPKDRELTTAEKRRAAEIIIQHRRFATWHIAEAELTDHFLAAGNRTLRDLVESVYRLEIRQSGKPRWGDKTPRYYECWRQLSFLFRRSQFVHIIRDGRDVSASLEKLGWHGQTERERAQYWAARVRLARQCQAELGPERGMIIRYEDLVLDSESVLGGICEFLHEDFAPSMLDFHLDAGDHVSAIDGPIHGKLARAPGPGDVQKWRTGALPDRLLCFESVASHELLDAGYELSCGARAQEQPRQNIETQ